MDFWIIAASLLPPDSPMRKRHLLNQRLTPEERLILQELAKRHRFGDFRRRALGLLALDEGRSVVDICQRLQINDQPVYNWVEAWREQGLVGILNGHKVGPPVKLTTEMLDVAARIAAEHLLPLGKIAARVKECFPDVLEFSLDHLFVRLKARGLSFKRTRLSLKKNVLSANSNA